MIPEQEYRTRAAVCSGDAVDGLSELY